MDRKPEKTETDMKCHMCGGGMRSIRTDLPFKLDEHRIIVVKCVPVEQCNFCGEYVLRDLTMQSLDLLIASMDNNVELEVRKYDSVMA